ncbi:hypothetical protein B1L02_20905 [Pseudoalteromonas piscicida]|nr:hypothetical protein B1L02_20905 [Pseudoalteromonas piscicida]AXQ99958.1 hypothetical protein D0N37_20410 [Pseudoalteromonas piscicida]
MSITRRKFCYLVALNEKFLTQLASDLLLQIEQVLRLIGITVPMWFEACSRLSPFNLVVITETPLSAQRGRRSFLPLFFC